MKKFITLLLVSTGMVSTVSATDYSVTLYYAVDAATVGTYTVKLNKNSGAGWATHNMTKTKRTYNGKVIYSCTYTETNEDIYNLQFQLWNGSSFVSQKDPINNNKTALSSVNGKMYVHDGSLINYDADCLKGSWDGFASPIYFEDGVATKDITAGTETYFKIQLAGTWYGAQNAGATMFWYDCSDWTFKSDGGQNCYIHTSATGTYTFTLDAANKKISVTFPEYTTNEVYFYNNHSWAFTPIVYLLGSSYWDDEDGSGSYGKTGQYGNDKGHAMTRVGETNVWKLVYPSGLNSSYITIVKNREDNKDNFEDTEAMYREDFNTNTPLYVPNTTGPINKNYTEGGTKWTAYWNTGEWYPFPTYTRTGLTIGNFGTICLPFAATVEGATVFKIVSTVGTPPSISGINLESVETLEAGKAYIFKATETTLTATMSGNYATATDANGMEGNISSTPVTLDGSEGYYVVGTDNKIHKVVAGGSGVSVAQFKAYITLTGLSAGARGLDFLPFEDSETTAIEAVKKEQKLNGEYYNLAGQRVAQPTKGLYIVNGKKVIK